MKPRRVGLGSGGTAFQSPSNGGFELKEGIHPKYELTEVVCACGNKFTTRSTMGAIHVEICSSCHPYFTGKQKLIDTAGRVEKYRKKYKLDKDAQSGTSS
jgi:large subunit ribosomal protein L31